MSLKHGAVTKGQSSVNGVFYDHEDVSQESHPCSCRRDDPSAVVVAVSRPGGDEEEHHVAVPQTVDFAQTLGVQA